jgi:hypothetical protein
MRGTSDAAKRALRPMLLAVGPLLTVAVGAQPAGGIERLAWLQGCWESRSAQRTVEEHWMAPGGRSMLGLSRTIRGNELLTYEMVVIREQAERFAYEAHPAGQPSAVFLSRDVNASSVVFENPEHDFPQRVGYTRNGTSLDAWIEGTNKGQHRRVDFSYQRVACPAAP